MAILRLGDYFFTDVEVPEMLPFGLNQRLAHYELPGGERITQSLGSTLPDISWQGIFRDSLRYEKVRYFTEQVKLAKPIIFSYSRFRYQVLISSFSATCRMENTPYSITLSVLEDKTSPAIFLPEVTWLDAVKEELQELETLNKLIADGDWSLRLQILAKIVEETQGLIPNAQSGISQITAQAGDLLDYTNKLISEVPF